MTNEKPPKLRSFFLSRLLSNLLQVLLGLVVLVLLFSLLSRHGYPYLVGVSVVVSNSMEPAVRPWDMVVYARTGFTVGDVVIYCVTPSYCVVHRVVDIVNFSTVNGDTTMVVTKGDNAEAVDSPLPVDKVVGRVVLVAPRELWIPLLLLLIAIALRDMVKAPVVGYSQVIAFSITVLLLASVYATAPRLINPEPVPVPVFNLAGVYVNYEACTLIIRYTDTLVLSSAQVHVNSTSATVLSIKDRELVAEPDHSLLSRAYETGLPLEVKVEAELNGVARLSGRYRVLIGGYDPVVNVSGNNLLVYNPNCYPVRVNVSMRYLANGAWYWSNTTIMVEGFSQAVLQAPEYAEEAYALVYWFKQGEARWTGTPLKTR
ncbi:MAG: signal peptidase I [Thermofilaceae archaeon]